MNREVWTFAEHREGTLHSSTYEILSKGREIADKIGGCLSGVIMGDDLEDLARELIEFGADCVHLLESPGLTLFPSSEAVEILCELVREYSPDIFLLGATSIGTELAPKLAARLKTGLSAHCIDLDVDERGNLIQIVPAFGGGVLASIICPNRRPQMATINPGVMKVAKKGFRDGKILKRTSHLKEEMKTEVLEIHREEPMAMPLEKAEVVVAGGWGVGDKENWRLLEELASLLRAGLGATRPAVDEGWAGESQMIGQSGKTVRPKLYLGFGISGVMHHMVGIQDAGFIIAINNDPNAEIFNMCDLGVVGDLREILPLLIRENRQKLK